jgi:hypothetical protein
MRAELQAVCVVCGRSGTWRVMRRGVLPRGSVRVWLCRLCFFASGADRRSIDRSSPSERV